MFSVEHSFHLKKKRGRAGNQAENQGGAGNLSGSQGGARPKKFGKHCVILSLKTNILEIFFACYNSPLAITALNVQ